MAYSLSLRYFKDAPTDIFIKGNEFLGFSSSIPIDILFLKRNKEVYLLLMTPIDLKRSNRPRFVV